MEKHIWPKQIVKQDGIIKNIDTLFIKKDLQIGLVENDNMEMFGDSSIILDFGRELNGGIRILIPDYSNAPITLRIRFGESITETMMELGQKNTTNDHSPRDFIIQTTNLCDIKIGHTGFRFVKIDKISAGPVLIVKSIVAYAEESQKNVIGQFKCDDELVNQIYDVSARTVKLCLQNGYVWDGIKRDRLVWIGDLHPELMSLSCMYDKLNEVKNSLIFVRNQTKLPDWMNGIPMYSMWWGIILYDYYHKTKDLKFVKDNLNYLVPLVDMLLTYIAKDGTTTFPSYFLDWPTSGHEDAIAGVHALTILAFQKISKLYKLFNLDTSNIQHAIKRLLSKKYKIKDKKQVMAFHAIAYEDYSQKTANFISKNGSAGFSTFMSYYILKALFLSGKRDESIELMKEYYNGMLQMGATTFWEDFDIDWTKNAFRIDQLPVENKKDIHGDFGNFCYKQFRHSLCHGWASGPVAFLTKYIAGIIPLSAGEDEILIKPYLGKLNHIKCVYPTIHGKVEVYHRKNKNGEILTKIISPKNIKFVLENCKKDR